MEVSDSTSDDPHDCVVEKNCTCTNVLALPPISRKKAKITVIILVLVNLLNYMDRFTLAGIPANVKNFYNLNEAENGQIQTVFFVSYTILSPVAGYLGDRVTRKYILISGLSIWTATTLASSFIPSHLFSLFLFARSVIGVGEASYATLAPAILSDLFIADERTIVLCLFYLAIPIGSGLGYILGSVLTQLTGVWQWALRITPIFGVICMFLLIFLHTDPPRGQAEGAQHMRTTSWLADLKYLILNKAFMYVSGAFTCACFILGGLTWFAVDLIQLALNSKHNDPAAYERYHVPIVFGLSTCLSGLFGVLAGSYLGRYTRKWIPAADAVVCSVGLFVSSPFLFFALISPAWSFYICVVLVFIAELLISFTWALVADMTMSVVIPTRRSTANAVQMIISHALGDAISPSIIGAISFAQTDSTSLESQYLSLQRALFLTPFICTLGAFLFLMSSLYLVKGKEDVHKAVEASQRNTTVMINERNENPVIPVA